MISYNKKDAVRLFCESGIALENLYYCSDCEILDTKKAVKQSFNSKKTATVNQINLSDFLKQRF